MADTVWESGKLTQVFHPAGSWDSGQRRLKLANFELLQWARELGGVSEQYVVPVGIATFQATDLGVAVREQETGREFGFYDGSPSLVVDYHQADGSDNILGLHSFGVF
jgi:hypothetical protein